MTEKLSMYVSEELKETYGSALNHLSNSLNGYAAVSVMSDKDTDEIRNVLLAKGPEPLNSMMTKLVERLFPGQSQGMLESQANRDCTKSMLEEILGAWRNGGAAAGGARLIIGGKEVSVGFVYLPTDLKMTPQVAIGNDLPGVPREERDQKLKINQLRDFAIFTAAHELGHLVDDLKSETYSYDVTKNPPQRKFSQAELNAAESNADRFASAQIRPMVSAGIISNANIDGELRHARALMGIADMLKAPRGVAPEIDHTTGIIDDVNRLQAAASTINELWHDFKKDRQPTPENTYAFMQEFKKRDNVSADVLHIANTYIQAYDIMIQGRIPDTIRKDMDVKKGIPDVAAQRQNEPIIVHTDVEANMVVNGKSMVNYFAGVAEGQAIQMVMSAPDIKLAQKVEKSMVPV